MDYHIHTTIIDDRIKDFRGNVVGYRILILDYHRVDCHIMGFRIVDFHTTVVVDLCIKDYHIVGFQILVDSCTLDLLLREFLKAIKLQC